MSSVPLPQVHVHRENHLILMDLVSALIIHATANLVKTVWDLSLWKAKAVNIELYRMCVY